MRICLATCLFVLVVGSASAQESILSNLEKIKANNAALESQPPPVQSTPATLMQTDAVFREKSGVAGQQGLPLVLWVGYSPEERPHNTVRGIVGIRTTSGFDAQRRKSIIIHWPDGKGWFSASERYEPMDDATVQAIVDQRRGVSYDTTPIFRGFQAAPVMRGRSANC